MIPRETAPTRISRSHAARFAACSLIACAGLTLAAAPPTPAAAQATSANLTGSTSRSLSTTQPGRLSIDGSFLRSALSDVSGLTLAQVVDRHGRSSWRVPNQHWRFGPYRHWDGRTLRGFDPLGRPYLTDRGHHRFWRSSPHHWRHFRNPHFYRRYDRHHRDFPGGRFDRHRDGHRSIAPSWRHRQFDRGIHRGPAFRGHFDRGLHRGPMIRRGPRIR